jgi:glycerol transport system ATP-binding protein
VQFGKTASIYRKPATTESAEVFSDPPINTAVISKNGDQAHLGNVAIWKVPEQLAGLPDGDYKIALRPHHLLLDGEGVEVNGTVQIAEISGSESIIRISVNGNVWVSQTQGIHTFVYGEKIRIYFDAANCMYFDAEDKLIDL